MSQANPKWKAVLQALPEHWPATFDKPQPLKIGIDGDMIRELHHLPYPFSKSAIHQALNVYTRTFRYLKSMQAGAGRIDLTGEMVGQVSETEAAAAAQLLRQLDKKKRRKTKRAKKQATSGKT